MAPANQTPEQKARDRIDNLLTQAGGIIQPKNKINLSGRLGVAVREYQTDAGPGEINLDQTGKGRSLTGSSRRSLAPILLN